MNYKILLIITTLISSSIFGMENQSQKQNNGQCQKILDISISKTLNPKDQISQVNQILRTSNLKLEDCQDGDGNTPLHVAILFDNYNLAAWILAQDPTLIAKENKFGEIPFKFGYDVQGRVRNPEFTKFFGTLLKAAKK